MSDKPSISSIEEQSSDLYKKLSYSERQEVVAKQFLKYCINKPKDIQTKTAQVIPFMDTVAEALIESSKNDYSIDVGVKTVQLYLQSPTAEYFGETLVRLKYLEEHEVEEMLLIKPKEVEFGAFLVEQGLLTTEQRDMAVIVQKRLFSITEVFQKVTHEETVDLDSDFIAHMKEIVLYFQTTTKEMERTIDQSHPEDIKKTMGRLQNIIGETESSSHTVLDLVDNSLEIIDQIETGANMLQDGDDWQEHLPKTVKQLLKTLNQLRDINIKVSNTQAIQDRIGQQLMKIIPVIEGFYNLLQELSVRLKINIEKQENPSEENEFAQDGYGSSQHNEDRMQNQGDVDDLLANLGL